MIEERTEQITDGAEAMPDFIHIWSEVGVTLCGATRTGHDECKGSGEGWGGWPIVSRDRLYCHNCFRPLCPICTRAAS